MKRALAICALGVALLTNGCGYVEMHEAVLRPTTGPTPGQVELYLAEQDPRRPFYEIALVEAFGYGTDADIEDMSAAMQERGRALGCDALVRVRFDIGRSFGHGYGVCVKWSRTVSATVQTTPAPVPAPAPAPAPAPTPAAAPPPQ